LQSIQTLNRKLLNTFRQLPAIAATTKGSFQSIATSPTGSALNAMGALKNKKKPLRAEMELVMVGIGMRKAEK